MGVQVPCRVHAEVPQEAAIWANQAAPGHSILPKYSVAEVIGSTVGRDEETIRTYIKNQEIADKQFDQLQLRLASS